MISLIVPTLGRVDELDRLLSSLEQQSYRDFEVIVVDQNGDDRIGPVLRKHGKLPIQHLGCERGASRARNLGLQHVKGGIVAFPDDDCWYPPDLLRTVAEWLASHPDYGALFATLRNDNNQTMGPRWPKGACAWSKTDIWNCGMTAVGFLRSEVARKMGGFNERLGPGSGTPYASGEDVDYFVRLFAVGAKIWYDPALTVHHPALDSSERIREKSYSYSLGGGYMLRLHHYPAYLLVRSLVRSCAGAVIYLLKFKFVVAHSYVLRAAGVAHGYFLGPSDFRKMSLPERL